MSASVPATRSTETAHSLGLASWYTTGHTDGFGDRLLMFDNSGATSLELLRFRPELAAEPGFEDLLRQRVQRLSTFRHPSFASVRAVEHLEGGEGLALVSTHTPGKRLSELLDARRTPAGLHPAFVSWLVQQITPLIAALQAHGYDIVHGALTIDRVVLTPDGRIAIVEHSLGSALRGLEMSPARLWREFGIVARPTSRGEACLDARGDVMQVGVVALSLLLGRRLPLQEVQERLPALLDEFSALPSARTSLFSAPLRKWLERAMQVHPQAYRSAAEAQDGLNELPAQAISSLPALLSSMMPGASDEGALAATLPLPARSATALPEPSRDKTSEPLTSEELDAFPAPFAHTDEAAEASADRRLDTPVSDSTSVARFRPAASSGAPVSIKFAAPAADSVKTGSAPIVNLPALLPPPAAELTANERATALTSVEERWAASLSSFSSPDSETRPLVSAMGRWIIIGLAAVALVEAVIIGTLTARRPDAATNAAAVPLAITLDTSRAGSTVLVDGRTAGTTPLQLTLDDTITSIRIVDGPSAAPDATRAPAPPQALPAAQTPAAPRPGSVRFTAAIDLEVSEGNRVLGRTANGAISIPAGTHQLDLVNADLGFRTRQSVTIRSGETSSFTLTTPMGRLSVNAQPWAQVWVDQTAVGETPIANLAVPIGTHEVTFRHPQLGERKEAVTVRADGVTRLSTTFGR